MKSIGFYLLLLYVLIECHVSSLQAVTSAASVPVHRFDQDELSEVGHNADANAAAKPLSPESSIILNGIASKSHQVQPTGTASPTSASSPSLSLSSRDFERNDQETTNVDNFFDILQNLLAKAKPLVKDIEQEAKRFEATVKHVGNGLLNKGVDLVKSIVGRTPLGNGLFTGLFSKEKKPQSINVSPSKNAESSEETSNINQPEKPQDKPKEKPAQDEEKEDQVKEKPMEKPTDKPNGDEKENLKEKPLEKQTAEDFKDNEKITPALNDKYEIVDSDINDEDNLI